MKRTRTKVQRISESGSSKRTSAQKPMLRLFQQSKDSLDRKVRRIEKIPMKGGGEVEEIESKQKRDGMFRY